ncbi:MAG: hypothetical protein ACXU71_06305, partial [Croceibacterium sp.]
ARVGLAVEAMEFRFLIHVFPARRLNPPVLVAELPAGPNAFAGVHPGCGGPGAGNAGGGRSNRPSLPAVLEKRALDPGRGPIERARK